MNAPAFLADSLIEAITPLQLKDLLAGNNPPVVLDVRELEEFAICSLPHAIHIPLRELPERFYQLPEGQVIVTLCHYGRRSLQAALFLKNHGIDKVLNLMGGIDAWAEQIAPSMKRY